MATATVIEKPGGGFRGVFGCPLDDIASKFGDFDDDVFEQRRLRQGPEIQTCQPNHGISKATIIFGSRFVDLRDSRKKI